MSDRLFSGVVSGVTSIQDQAAAAAFNAARIGWNKMTDRYSEQIALKTGAMRRTFSNVGLDIVDSQRGFQNIRFSVAEIYSRMVSSLPYSEHHLEVGPTGLSFYIKPTTKGTEPIMSAKFIPILVQETQNEFLRQLRIRGLQVRRRR